MKILCDTGLIASAGIPGKEMPSSPSFGLSSVKHFHFVFVIDSHDLNM
jgi:hypothetical protein